MLAAQLPAFQKSCMKMLPKFAAAILLLTLATAVQNTALALPPVFGPEYDGKTQKDTLARALISPQRIVWKNDGGEKLVANEAVLLRRGDSQSVLGRRNMCVMKSTGTKTASILLDYGREIHGGLQLVMGSSARREPSLVRIRFGESVGECNSETNNSEWMVGRSTDDHAKRDIVMEIPRDGMIEIGNTGFRFVRIDLLQKNTAIHIKEARAILRYRDIPYLGSFKSSDPRLDQIWLTGAYTVHLNMQEYLWDGIKRDRLVWLGDMHPEVSSIRAVFGDNETVPKSLDLACAQFPLPGWMNKIPTYSLWYLIIHHDWYMQNGDLAFMQKHRSYILGLIDQIDRHIDENGIEKTKTREFLDWPSSPNAEGVKAGCRALMVWAMQHAAKLCAWLDEPEYIKKTGAITTRLNRSIKDHNNLKQAAALMALAGILPPEKACDEVVSVGGPKNFSTFYGYYMLEAQALAGQHRQAIDIIRAYWGGMLDMGATTFWEDFDLEWTKNAARLDELTPPGKKDIHGDFGAYCYPGYRHSFCHGWASGPTAWMSAHILGIQVLEPGCKTIKIAPHLGDLDWAEGAYPTPLGVLKVRHEKDASGKITTTIDAPAGIKIVRP
ncbi:alpha-L-rhamnosidase [Ereboglobus sp. PH5-10]|nr:alpha-L-rhamnosidase [Ereboglobus sp. PH5-10]